MAAVTDVRGQGPGLECKLVAFIYLLKCPIKKLFK